MQNQKNKSSDVATTRTMDPRQSVRLEDGRPLRGTEMTCSGRIALYMKYGPVKLNPFALVVIPGRDDALILGCRTLKISALCVCAGLTECARRKVERRENLTETVSYIACRLMTLSVEAMQQTMD